MKNRQKGKPPDFIRPGWEKVLVRLKEELEHEKDSVRRSMLLFETAEILLNEKNDEDAASKLLVEAVNLNHGLYAAVSRLLYIHSGRRSLKNILRLLSSERRALDGEKDSARIFTMEGLYRWVFGEPRESFIRSLDSALEVDPDYTTALLLKSAGTRYSPMERLDAYTRLASNTRHGAWRAALLISAVFSAFEAEDNARARQLLADLKNVDCDNRNSVDMFLALAALEGMAGMHTEQAESYEKAAGVFTHLLGADEDVTEILKGWTRRQMLGAAGSMLQQAAWTLMRTAGHGERVLSLLTRAQEILRDSLLLKNERALFLCREGRFDEVLDMDGAVDWLEKEFLKDVELLSTGKRSDAPVDSDAGASCYEAFRELERAYAQKESAGAISDRVLSFENLPDTVVVSSLLRACVQAGPDDAAVCNPHALARAAVRAPHMMPVDVASLLLYAAGALDEDKVNMMKRVEGASDRETVSNLALLAHHAFNGLDRPALAVELYDKAVSEKGPLPWASFISSLASLSAGDEQSAAQRWIEIANAFSGTPAEADFMAAGAWLTGTDPAMAHIATELIEKVLEIDPAHPLASSVKQAVVLEAENYRDLDEALQKQSEATFDPGDAVRIALARSFLHGHQLGDTQKALEFIMDVHNDIIDSGSKEDTIAVLWYAASLAEQNADYEALKGLLEEIVENGSPGGRIHSLSCLRLAEINSWVMDSVDEGAGIFEKIDSPPGIADAAFLEKAFALAMQGDTEKLITLLPENGETGKLTKRCVCALSAAAALAGGDAESFSLNAAGLGDDDAGGWRLLAYLASCSQGNEKEECAESLLDNRTPPGVRFCIGTRQPAVKSPSSLEDFMRQGMLRLPSPTALDDAQIMWAADRADSSWPSMWRAELFRRRSALAADDAEKAHYLLELAEALEDMDEIEECTEVFSECISLVPGHLPALRGLARTAWLADRVSVGAKAEIELAEYAPDPAEAAAGCFRAAKLWMTEGNREEEEAACRRGLEYDPGHDGCFNHLKDIYIENDDHEALKSLLWSRTEVEKDFKTLGALYSDLSDSLIAVDDIDGAMEALDRLLNVDPDRSDAIRTKAFLLLEAERWEEMLWVVDDLGGEQSDVGELRDLWFKAAEIAEVKLEDVDRAVGYLEGLLRRGDSDPLTAQALLEMALRHGLHAEAADARAELASMAMMDDNVEVAVEHLKKESRLRLKDLKDKAGAKEALGRLLDIHPLDMEILEDWIDLEPAAAEKERRLHRAAGELRSKYLASPDKPDGVRSLLHIMRLREDAEGVRLAKDLLEELDPGKASIPPPRPYTPRDPEGVLGPELLSQLRHPDDAGAGHLIMSLTAPYASELAGRSPRDLKRNLEKLSPLDSGHPVAARIIRAGEAAGIGPVQVYEGGDPLSIGAVEGEGICIRAGSQVGADLSPRLTFSLGRELWIASLGLAASGDDIIDRLASGIAAVCISAGRDTALSTIADTTARVKDNVSRVLPKNVMNQAALAVSGMEQVSEAGILDMATAAVLSADRYAFVLCGEVREAVACIRTAGNESMSRLSVRDRLNALFAFIVSDEVLRIRRSLGLCPEKDEV